MKRQLKSGSGKTVTDPKQAIAIALAETTKKGAKAPDKSASKKTATKKVARKK